MSEKRDEDARKQVRMEFSEHVNMSPSQIESWLERDESKEVGQDSGDGESVGRKSAKKIIAIKRQTVDEHTEADYDHMLKTTNYIKRHLAQRPEGDVSATPWRYSLMNWGHDPLK